MSVQIKSAGLASKYGHLPTKSAVIRAMFADGVTKMQISKELDIRYQHVRNVLLQPLSTKAPVVQMTREEQIALLEEQLKALREQG